MHSVRGSLDKRRCILGLEEGLGRRGRKTALTVELTVALAVAFAASGITLLVPSAEAASVVTTISLSGGATPFQAVYNAANGFIYVSNAASSQVSIISSVSHTSVIHMNQANCISGCTYSYGVYDPSVPEVDFASSVSSGIFAGFQGTGTNTHNLGSCTGYTPESIAYDPANSEVYGFAQSSSGGELQQIHGLNHITGCSALKGIPWFAAYATSNYTMWVAEGTSGSLGQVEV